jgi:hypothetical protein
MGDMLIEVEAYGPPIMKSKAFMGGNLWSK